MSTGDASKRIFILEIKTRTLKDSMSVKPQKAELTLIVFRLEVDYVSPLSQQQQEQQQQPSPKVIIIPIHAKLLKGF